MKKIKRLAVFVLLALGLVFAGKTSDCSGAEKLSLIPASDTFQLMEQPEENRETPSLQWIPDTTRHITGEEGFEYYLDNRSDGKGLWISYDGSGAGSSWDLIYQTEDEGETWVCLGSLSYCSAGRTYAFEEDKVVLITVCNHVDDPYCAVFYLSGDYGVNWNAFHVEDLLPRDCGSPELHIYPQVLALEGDLLTLGFFRCNGAEVRISDDTQERYYFYVASYRIGEDTLSQEEVIYEDAYYRDGVFDNFILPDSSIRSLSPEYVRSQLGDDDEQTLRLAINEIYARKGYSFAGTKYENYFSACPWYTDSGSHTVEFTELEQNNVDLLAYMEQLMD